VADGGSSGDYHASVTTTVPGRIWSRIILSSAVAFLLAT